MHRKFNRGHERKTSGVKPRSRLEEIDFKGQDCEGMGGINMTKDTACWRVYVSRVMDFRGP
jgi:hypothetical protein